MQAGTLQYQPLVTRERDKRLGMPLESILLYEPEVTQNMARRYIRHNIIEALGLRHNNKLRCFERVDDKWVELSDLAATPWFHWALEHIEIVNEAELDAKLNSASKSHINVLTRWIKGLKIELKSKRVRTSQVTDFKMDDFESADGIKGDPLSNGTTEKTVSVDHPNKSVGVTKNAKVKQGFVRLYQADDKTLHRAWEVFEADMRVQDDDEPAPTRVITRSASKPEQKSDYAALPIDQLAPHIEAYVRECDNKLSCCLLGKAFEIDATIVADSMPLS